MFQHRRRFFRRRAGLLSGAHFCRSGAAGVGIHGTVFYRLYCYRRHSLPGSLFYTGCYPAHNSGEPALESPAQFTAGGVVIGSTISVRCASRGKKMVVIGRTIRTFFCGRQVVIHSTICAVGKIRLLLSAAHFGISSAFQTCPDRVVIQRTFPAVGLLSGAQFPNCRIWAAVVIDGTFLKNPPYSVHPVLLFTAQFVFSGAERLLSGAQFAKIRFFLRRVLPWVVSLRTVCPAGAGVVIDGTIQGFFSTGCYSAHISPRQDFSIRPVGMLRTFLTFPFSRPGLLYSTLFKNPTKFSLPPFSCKKTFLLLLRFAHCCVLHICVGMLRTAPL